MTDDDDVRHRRGGGGDVGESHLRLGTGGGICLGTAALQHRQHNTFAHTVALQRHELFGIEREDRFVAVDQREDHRL